MSENKSPRSLAASAPTPEPAAGGNPYLSLDLEGRDDRRRLQVALAVAAAAHLALFAVTFPKAAAEPLPAVAQQKVYVIQQHRFKKPEPPPPEPIPEERRTVAVPDQTPDDPEPIRLIEEIVEPDRELPPIDWVTEIPTAPPAPPTPPVSNQPMEMTAEVVRPVKVSGRDPVYSEMARRVRLQGSVIVRMVVDREGQVEEVRLLKDLGMGLGESTVTAVRQWRFQPATLRGKPVAVFYDLTVHFGLN